MTSTFNALMILVDQHVHLVLDTQLISYSFSSSCCNSLSRASIISYHCCEFKEPLFPSVWLDWLDGLIIEISGFENVVSSRKLPGVYDSLSRNSIISDHCGDFPIEDPSLESLLATISLGLILLILSSFGVIRLDDSTE